MSKPDFAQRREQLLDRLEARVRQDDRITALWLQGSRTDGIADRRWDASVVRWSDV